MKELNSYDSSAFNRMFSQLISYKGDSLTQLKNAFKEAYVSAQNSQNIVNNKENLELQHSITNIDLPYEIIKKYVNNNAKTIKGIKNSEYSEKQIYSMIQHDVDTYPNIVKPGINI